MGSPVFFNKCDVVYVSIHKISRRRIFYMSVPRHDGDSCYGSAAGVVSTDNTCTLLDEDIESLTLIEYYSDDMNLDISMKCRGVVIGFS
jgi:hypothetical protein